jgi:arginine:pyruvate transaminase
MKMTNGEVMRYASIINRLASMRGSGWAVHRAGRRMKAEGQDVIELSIGEPDISPDTALLDETARSMYSGRTRYASGRGEAVVLRALAEKYGRRRQGVTDRNFLCFPGTQSALFAVMTSLVEDGDGVLVGDPLYATYESVITSTGAHPIFVPLHAEKRFHLQADDLRQAMTPEARVLLLNTPHNPTGAVLTQDEIAAIGVVCQEHDLWIVCDEVYEELIFGDVVFASPFDFPELANRTVVVSSISKSHAATGFRSGWAAGPVQFCDAVQPVSEAMLFGGQPFIADMTAMALSRHFDTVDIMRTNYRRRAAIVEAAFPPGGLIKALPPEGGMFILLDIGATSLTGDEFAWALLEQERVSVMPGSSFGAQAKSLIRLSLTVPDDVLVIAVQRIKDLSTHLCEAVATR